MDTNILWSFIYLQEILYLCVDFSFCCNIEVVDFLWNRTVDSLKTSFQSTAVDFIRYEGIAERQTPYMGRGKLTEHAQNLQGCEKHNLRKAVGNI